MHPLARQKNTGDVLSPTYVDVQRIATRHNPSTFFPYLAMRGLCLWKGQKHPLMLNIFVGQSDKLDIHKQLFCYNLWTRELLFHVFPLLQKNSCKAVSTIIFNGLQILMILFFLETTFPFSKVMVLCEIFLAQMILLKCAVWNLIWK